MALPVVVAQSASREDVRSAEEEQLGPTFVGEFILLVKGECYCRDCGKQEYSKSDRYWVCPSCGGPAWPTEEGSL